MIKHNANGGESIYVPRALKASERQTLREPGTHYRGQVVSLSKCTFKFKMTTYGSLTFTQNVIN